MINLTWKDGTFRHRTTKFECYCNQLKRTTEQCTLSEDIPSEKATEAKIDGVNVQILILFRLISGLT
jgi:hypothetical protein